jgi:outer membrane protein, heavy metal efflux system
MVLWAGCAAPLAQRSLPETRQAPPVIPDAQVNRLPPVERPYMDPQVQPAGLVVPSGPAASGPGAGGETSRSTAVINAVSTSSAPPVGRAPVQEEVPRPRYNTAVSDPPTLPDRLKMPAGLPGVNVPPLWIPADPQRKMQAIETLFPDLPPMPKLIQPVRGDQIYTLADLEQMAINNSPIIVQAQAAITVAMGQAIQAGVYPNPTVGYEADTVGSAGTRNYQGVFGTQVVKTAGKLGLARSVANVNVMNAQLAMRRARIDLMAQVKANYFAILVAQQSVSINEALVQLTNEAYRIQDDKLKGGMATPYEPAQLRSLAVVARTALAQAQMNYISTWKQLGVTLGMPGLPMARLEGSAEMPVPRLTYEAALVRLLNVHPDVQAARNSQGQARLQQRLELVTPVPDVNVYGTFQRDFTTPNVPRTTYNIQFGLPVPLFDRNRGNIMSAQGNIVRTAEDVRRVEYMLTQQLVDAFNRFETSRILLQYNREQILPDLARSYRGVYERYQQEGEGRRGQPAGVGFSDIVFAQQNLTLQFGTYIGLLGTQWAAVADLARLLQVENLSELNLGLGDVPVAPHPGEAAPR